MLGKLFFLSLSFSFLFSSSIKFHGNSLINFPSSDLYSVINIKSSSFDLFNNYSSSLSPDIISKKIINYYKSKGFYNTSIDYSVSNDIISFNIIERSQIKINSISYSGNFIFSKNVLFKNSLFDTSSFKKFKSDILHQLHSSGYYKPSLSIKAIINSNNYSVDIIVSVKKNNLFYFSTILVNNSSVISHFISSNISIHESNIFSIDLLNETKDNLFKLDLFKHISFDYSFDKSNVVVNIILIDKPKRIIKSSLGFDSFEGVRGKISWTHRNLFDHYERFSFSSFYSSKKTGIDNSFSKPSIFLPFFHKYVNFNSYTSFSSENISMIEKKQLSSTPLFHKKISSFDNYLGFKIELDSVIDKSLLSIYQSNHFFNSFFYQLKYDSRNSILNPSSGIFFNSSFELSSPLIFSDSSFSKSIIDFRTYKSFDYFIWANKFKIGSLSKTLPRFKRFFAGGSLSNRGFSFNDVGLKDSYNIPLGGHSIVDLSSEIRIPLSTSFDLSLFVDSTSLNLDVLDFSSNYSNSLGIGLRYNTIVGPFRFDVASPLDSSSFSIHFSIGQSF
jgi:translocation and assembly module TamA